MGRGVIAALLLDWMMAFVLSWILAMVPAIVASLSGRPAQAPSGGGTLVPAATAVVTPLAGAVLGGYLAFLLAQGRAPWLHATIVGAVLALLAGFVAGRQAAPSGLPAWVLLAVIGVKLAGALAGGAVATLLLRRAAAEREA